MTATKTCTRCGIPKPIDRFHAAPNTRDGRHTACRECRNEREKVRSRDYYRAHREEVRAQKREYMREYMRRRRAAARGEG